MNGLILTDGLIHRGLRITANVLLDLDQPVGPSAPQAAGGDAAEATAGKSVFVTAARGSLVLPQDGSWSVIKQQTNTGDVHQLSPQELVPMIKPNGSPDFLVAHSAHVYVAASNAHYGVLQSTGTQKLLFDLPQFAPGTFKLKSAQTYTLTSCSTPRVYEHRERARTDRR